MCGICRDACEDARDACRDARNAEYVSYIEIDDIGDLILFILYPSVTPLLTIGGAVSLPVLICKFVAKCSGVDIYGLILGGFLGGLCGGMTFAALLPQLCQFSIYLVCNVPYSISRCTCGLSIVANYAIDKLAGCCSRLARLAGFSGRNGQEIDIESRSGEEFSEITTSSSQESESDEDINQTEQSQPRFSRKPSFASLMNPFSIFYRSEQAASESMPQGRRLSFAGLMNPFSFFRASSEETDLENGAIVESETDTPEDTSLSLTTENGI